MLGVITSIIESYGLIGVLVGTFLSYSVLPLPTELAVILASGVHAAYLVFLMALLGSTLGSVLNFYIGARGKGYLLKKETPRYKWARDTFNKHGGWGILFFSWLPIVGDPLIIVAGALNMDFKKFLVYSTLAKIWYFVLLIFLGVNLMGWFGF